MVTEGAARLSELRASPTCQPGAGESRIVEDNEELFEVRERGAARRERRIDGGVPKWNWRLKI